LSRPLLRRALAPAALALALLLPASRAAPPQAVPPDDPARSDQVADPEELERQDLELEERPDASFATPEQVIDHVQGELGEPWEWSGEVPNLVVIRNAGAGYRPSPSEAAYDDLFLVVTPSQVTQYSYGNAEGTEHPTYVRKYGYDRYVDPNIGKAMTPALAPGRYRFLVGKHRDQYKALRVHSWDWERMGLPSQRRNGKRGPYDVGAVNVHKGGSSWNWSVGCFTIHYSRYQSFIDQFPWAKWGRLYVVGDWDGGAPTRKLLADARSRRRSALFQALEVRHGLW